MKVISGPAAVIRSCYACLAKLELSLEDLRLGSSKNSWENMEFVFTCPCCNAVVEAYNIYRTDDANRLPKKWIDKLMAK